jgi:DNA-binding CsgD family transcriptional regulator
MPIPFNHFHHGLLVRHRLPAPPVIASTGELPSGTLALTDSDWEAICASLAFSKRESQIARLVLDDATEADIAARLSISPHTVHTYIDRLYRKLHVHSRPQLILQMFNTHLSCCASRKN